MVAGQKGTIASVGNLFQKLPVRRRELEKNIKREYGKVLGLLHAYACISTRVRFSVKNQTTKDRNALVFSTNSNVTTKENIANVYGAKTLLALIPLDLELEFQPSSGGRRLTGQEPEEWNKIIVQGHISRPVFGEGRQTPDRQMFFVNSRPCGLPQIAKAFNEVYKSYNVTQSPFIFADFQMDTNAYDVNVSPDKRTILLHDSGALIQSLKTSLTELFDRQDQTVPQSEISRTQPSIKQHVKDDTSWETPSKRSSAPMIRDPVERTAENTSGNDVEEDDDLARRNISDIVHQKSYGGVETETAKGISEAYGASSSQNDIEETQGVEEAVVTEQDKAQSTLPVRDAVTTSSKAHTSGSANEETESIEADHDEQASSPPEDTQKDTPNVIQNAFDRMRPTRPQPELATITIGNKTITSMVGSGVPSKRSADSVGSLTTSRPKRRIHIPSKNNKFSQSLRNFAAPGTQSQEQDDRSSEGSDEEESQGETGESGVDEPEYHSPTPEQEHENVSEQVEPAEDIQLDQAEPEASNVDIEEQASNESDDSYVDDEERQTRDEAKVKQLIREAEERAALPSQHNTARANKMSRGPGRKDSTVQLMGTIDGSISRIEAHMKTWRDNLKSLSQYRSEAQGEEGSFASQEQPETRLSLTVSKDDFSKMRIVGQFNLGFILATRSREESSKKTAEDELFIIDQHASDEKYNFERLQAETVVQNQRLVKPKTLDLTAVEEEVIIDNLPTLERNGFIVEVDTSGDEPIGRRCKLVSLPLSKEIVFNVRDLEELIVLLSESPPIDSSQGSDAYVPRPDKVRKMFAMRACRSSIMVGKTLTSTQMEKVVRHMGTIDKPWNCPHGRPTMRHLMSLGQWFEWDENDREDDESVDEGSDEGSGSGEDDGWDIWREFLGEEGDIEEEEQ